MKSLSKISKKQYIFIAIFSLAAILIFLLWPRCNYLCHAQALYKNRIFFELRGIVSKLKKDKGTISVQIDPSHFSNSFLRDNGVGYWGVTESGTIFVSDAQGIVLLVAEPQVNVGEVNWRCRFYPHSLEIPLCPPERKS